MKVLIALSGLHRYNRGAEIAFISVAKELVKAGDTVTLIGSGPSNNATPYRFLRAPSLPRENFENFPKLVVLRSEFVYEELMFLPGLLCRYRPADYDVTLACSYPFTNWLLRRPTLGGSRPPHVYVTHNGDWPAYSSDSEYRFFGCEGLICTNPDFYERNKDRWRCALIPNGVDNVKFQPGIPRRQEFGLPADQLVVLLVSALNPSKRIDAAIDAVSRIPNAWLVVAGDGPLRQAVDQHAARLLPGRYKRLSVLPERMPALYQSADVLLHVAKDEPFGMIFLEAMACGLPIVADDSPRRRWIVGNDEFLVDTADTDGISRQIVRAYDASSSGRQQRVERAAGFSWDKIGADFRKFLLEVISARRHPEP